MRTPMMLALALLFLPAAVFAASAPRTFQELANLIVVILNNASVVLIVAGIVIYFYGISTNILKFGDEGWEKVKSYFLWGLIVLFVMMSVWGILRVIQDTLFGGDQAISPGGSSDTGETVQTDVFQSAGFDSRR
ncbi:MAG: hypothetical protein RLZZ416_510 [Candidatus Parcubacteria bacterium]|jgi:nitric oxide reductase large subunit